MQGRNCIWSRNLQAGEIEAANNNCRLLNLPASAHASLSLDAVFMRLDGSLEVSPKGLTGSAFTWRGHTKELSMKLAYPLIYHATFAERYEEASIEIE